VRPRVPCHLTPRSTRTRADAPPCAWVVLRAPVTGHVRGHMEVSTNLDVGKIVFGIYVFGVIWLQRFAPLELRKKYLKFSVAGIGIMFLGGILLPMGPDWIVTLALIPMIALISWLNYRMVDVCLACGEVIWSMGLKRPKLCSKCGANLKV